MRKLLVNAALAGLSWQAPTSQRNYAVDGQGVASIMADNPENGTLDTTEARAAGFGDYAATRVKLKNADFGKRRAPQTVAGDVKMVDMPPRVVVCKSGNEYCPADDGSVDCLAADETELRELGFA